MGRSSVEVSDWNSVRIVSRPKAIHLDKKWASLETDRLSHKRSFVRLHRAWFYGV
jgi:hypothetical protein